MKKISFFLMAIVVIVIGLLVGTLNSELVQLDLLWIQFELPLGLAILLGFSLGVIAGLGLIYIGRVIPLRIQLRKLRTSTALRDSPGRQDTPGSSRPDD